MLQLLHGGVGIFDGTETVEIQIDSNGVYFYKNGAEIGASGTPSPSASFTVKDGLVTGWSYPITTVGGTIGLGNISINVSEGLITGWNYPTTWSGTVLINSGANTLHFTNGILTSIT